MNFSIIGRNGQIVIPKALRDKYNLTAGTKIFFKETSNGINLRHIDPDIIRNARGMSPRKKDEKPMEEWWPKFKTEG